MGGYGSGRKSTRFKADECIILDVNFLNKKGCLASGFSGSWVWHKAGNNKNLIELSFDDQSLLLRSTQRVGISNQHKSVTQEISILFKKCNLGGVRPYFRCGNVTEGRACQRFAVKLFRTADRFRCRKCAQVSYRSQSRTKFKRISDRSDLLRSKMRGKAGVLNPTPEKPKGMWWRTYHREIKRIQEADARVWAQFTEDADQYLSRLDPDWKTRHR